MEIFSRQMSSQELGSTKAKGLKKDAYTILFQGREYVGKTSILTRVLKNEYKGKYTPTVEETHSEEFELNGNKVKVDMIDCTGAYSFPAMRRLRMRNSDAFVFVFAVDDAESLKSVETLIDELKEARDEDDISEPVVVVANKIDLDPTEYKVDLAMTEMEYRFTKGFGFVDVSAKNDKNLINIFNEILSMANIDLTIPDEIRRQSSCFKLSESQIHMMKLSEEMAKKEKMRRRLSKIPIIRHFSVSNDGGQDDSSGDNSPRDNRVFNSEINLARLSVTSVDTSPVHSAPHSPVNSRHRYSILNLLDRGRATSSTSGDHSPRDKRDSNDEIDIPRLSENNLDFSSSISPPHSASNSAPHSAPHSRPHSPNTNRPCFDLSEESAENVCVGKSRETLTPSSEPTWKPKTPKCNKVERLKRGSAPVITPLVKRPSRASRLRVGRKTSQISCKVS